MALLGREVCSRFVLFMLLNKRGTRINRLISEGWGGLLTLITQYLFELKLRIFVFIQTFNTQKNHPDHVNTHKIQHEIKFCVY